MLTPVQNCKKCITFGNLRIISQEGDIRQQFVLFPPSFLKGGEVNFDYLPWRGESEKLKKAGGSMVQGQVFLKWGGGGERGWHFSYLIFSWFIKLLYPLQNCDRHLKKSNFFLPHKSYEKRSF